MPKQLQECPKTKEVSYINLILLSQSIFGPSLTMNYEEHIDRGGESVLKAKQEKRYPIIQDSCA